MAIDTIYKRASAAGTLWPQGTIDRIAATEEYNGIPLAVTSPVGVPEKHGLTMHRTVAAMATRSDPGGYTVGRDQGGHTMGRTPTGYTTGRTRGALAGRRR